MVEWPKTPTPKSWRLNCPPGFESQCKQLYIFFISHKIKSMGKCVNGYIKVKAHKRKCKRDSAFSTKELKTLTRRELKQYIRELRKRRKKQKGYRSKTYANAWRLYKATPRRKPPSIPSKNRTRKRLLPVPKPHFAKRLRKKYVQKPKPLPPKRAPPPRPKKKRKVALTQVVEDKPANPAFATHDKVVSDPNEAMVINIIRKVQGLREGQIPANVLKLIRSEMKKHRIQGELSDPELKKKAQAIAARLEKDVKTKELSEEQIDENLKGRVKLIEQEIDNAYEHYLQLYNDSKQTEADEDEFISGVAEIVIEISTELGLPDSEYMIDLAKDLLEPLGYGEDAQWEWINNISREYRDTKKKLNKMIRNHYYGKKKSKERKETV